MGYNQAEEAEHNRTEFIKTALENGINVSFYAEYGSYKLRATLRGVAGYLKEGNEVVCQVATRDSEARPEYDSNRAHALLKVYVSGESRKRIVTSAVRKGVPLLIIEETLTGYNVSIGFVGRQV